ncbi:arginine--tRNA ligase [Vallitalea pronyensis]|uniref:Arginine--tRNA ligase n=1 Tax=Vallitalea pronyensis TaxID=1348613 RepID=A0A8J8SHH3_9FIRM|nr:arginine--tRNA ligase [Vallitalea pronyensis]QUI23576.1 arginine--tRNA ligase [Vallitalea pronyensis]
MMRTYTQLIDACLQEPFDKMVCHFTRPPSLALGDLSLPCFPLAKKLKKSPMDIAHELKDAFHSLSFIEQVVAKDGYLNFYFKRRQVIQDTLLEIKHKKHQYGSNESGIGKTALIEHTSINPNASPHVGRARNALIGDVLKRLMTFEGYKVNTHYFVNDVGKQIAMLVYATQHEEKVTFKELLQHYVRMHEAMKDNPQIEEEIFKLLYAFENGDVSVRKSFQNIVDICIKGQVGLFKDLSINYDTFQYESAYIFNGALQEVLKQLKTTGNLEEDEEGRLVLNLEAYNIPTKAPYLVLSRKDKTSLYPLRDIAYSMHKAKTNTHVNMIVLGEDQKSYHQQVSAALDLLGYTAPTPVHYSFVLLKDGKMATREGKVVLLEDFMSLAIEKSMAYMKENNREVDVTTAKTIAYGAVKYAILKTANHKNVTFDLEKALSFEGNTGPYLQYSIARIHSILDKCQFQEDEQIDYGLLEEDLVYDLILDLLFFNDVVAKALKDASPHIIANYVYGLTKKFSTFYHQCSIIHAKSKALQSARLALIKGVIQVSINALHLLGINVVKSM